MQLLGREVDKGWNTPRDWSVVYGKKALDLINHTRAHAGLTPLNWSDKLHEVAYSWSLKQARVGKISHDNYDQNERLVLNALPDIKHYAESVGLSESRPTSKAIDNIVDQWQASELVRVNIEGNFSHSAVGVAEEDGRVFCT